MDFYYFVNECFSLICLISLFNSIRGLFNAKLAHVEKLLWYYLTYALGDKGVHIFPKSENECNRVTGF